MKISREFKIHVCPACGAEMADSAIKRCGISLERPMLFFEYNCPSCLYEGRFVINLERPIEPPDALRLLAELLPETKESKGNTASQLNNIFVVQDLLRLGGKDAPREPSKNDADLP